LDFRQPGTPKVAGSSPSLPHSPTKLNTNSAPHEEAAPEPQVGLGELFFAFLMVGLMGFGGLAPAAHHMIVEKKKWYTPKEYVELFALCSILPGGNILNASIMIGNRFQGWLGAVAAISALMLTPLILLVILAVTYDSFQDVPEVKAATAGAASAAAGLIIGTAGKLIRGVEKSLTSLVFGVVTFVSIAVLRFPLQAVMLTLVPLSIGWALYRARQAGAGK